MVSIGGVLSLRDHSAACRGAATVCQAIAPRGGIHTSISRHFVYQVLGRPVNLSMLDARGAKMPGFTAAATRCCRCTPSPSLHMNKFPRINIGDEETVTLALLLLKPSDASPSRGLAPCTALHCTVTARHPARPSLTPTT
ncbi:hypothetical protein E2C01_008165 [Portunus trituberculatus]|uniref:Uncharacterized protein n=1 Tax=Portunus trituberculatus TaxID=210409 RepID=A0A5B7D230_PORTR|nr:hypothetical protein [Portunus trituberculatus]